jgi:tetratricopeptide (TPR) repeat protein
VSDIGKELGVDYILEGTIRWQKSLDGPGRVRITPQLVKSADGAHIWANIYENELTRVFDVQSDVSQKVVSALNVTLLEPERHQLSSQQTQNIEAYNYYLKGNDYWRRIAAGTDAPNLRLAAHLYEQSVEADSQYADAWARLGRAHVELYWHHEKDSADLQMARRCIDRAMALDPQSAEVRIAEGSYHYHAMDYDLALSEFNQARKLQPNNADLVMEIAYVHRRQGRPESFDEMKRALTLDPLASGYYHQAASTAILFGRYDEVIPLCDQAMALTPDFADAYTTKALFLVARNGDTAAAQALLVAAQPFIQPTPAYYRSRGILHMLCGRFEEAIQCFELGHDYTFPESESYYRGFLYELMGQKARAHAVYDSTLHLIEAELDKNHDFANPYATYGLVLAALGRGPEALEATRKAIELNKNAQTIQNCRLALAKVHTILGDYDSAVAELERALREPGLETIYSIRLDPGFAPLHTNPRFQKLVASPL